MPNLSGLREKISFKSGMTTMTQIALIILDRRVLVPGYMPLRIVSVVM